MRTTHRQYWVFPPLFLFSAVHGGPAGETGPRYMTSGQSSTCSDMLRA